MRQIRRRIKTVTWQILINQNITHTPSSLYRCTHLYTTHTQSVSVQHCAGHTFEQLAAHWCMGVALCRRSADFCHSVPPLCLLHPPRLCVIQSDKTGDLLAPIISLPEAQARLLPFISTIVSVCYLRMCSLTTATHAHTHSHPPPPPSSLSHLWIGLPCVYS